MTLEFGVVVPTWGAFGDPAKIRRLILAAEELGYASVWVGDHLLLPDYAVSLSPANWYEALSTCMLGLGWTQRLRFGTDVLVAPYRDPRLLAKMAATADRLSGGRLTLGLGVGFLAGELRALGQDPAQRGAVTDECLAVLRLLFETEGAVGFEGRHYRFDPVHCEPKPLQQPLPLWVGGNGRRGVRRAALLGDGWHPLFPTPEQYAEGRATILKLRAEHGLEARPFRFSYSCPETRILADDAPFPSATGYAGATDLPPDYAYAPPPPRDPSGRPLFMGNAEQLVGDFGRLAAAGVEHVALRFWAGSPAAGLEDSLEQMERFAAKVVPRFRALGALVLALASVLSFGALAAEPGQAQALLSVPILRPEVVFSSTTTVHTFRVDLKTLPARPVLRITATPDATDASMQLEIRATNWQNASGGGFCPGPTTTYTSTSGPGVASLDRAFHFCAPAPATLPTGASVDIQIRALHFGSGSAPASVVVVIRGETAPATGSLNDAVDTNLASQQILFPAVRDTVLYEDATAGSNGAGQFLWAGEIFALGFPAANYLRRSLLAFDVTPAVSPVSVVDKATLALGVTGLLGSDGTLRVHEVGPTASLFYWDEGNADAIDPEFSAASSSTPAATWLLRSTGVPWSIPGGDAVGPTLVTLNITTTGLKGFSTTSLTASVQDVVAGGDDLVGFLLSGPSATLASRGIQFASRQHPTASLRPALIVDFHQTEPYTAGTAPTGAHTFINEGQNLRWIYDLDGDSIYETPIGGVCEITDTTTPTQLPYSYRFQGAPGFTGVDCCTWRVDSPATGTVGTGQTLFFHNLDPGNPANLPPDTDRDGIRDLCDNCPAVPNGPLVGSCSSGPKLGAPCRSNLDCGGGGVCGMSQADANGDFIGDACVPEPGFAAGLAAGLIGLGLSARRRADRFC